MKIKSYPKTMDQIVRMKMAEREHDASVKAAVHNKAIENAKTMLQDNMPMDLVARYSGLSLSEVQALR